MHTLVLVAFLLALPPENTTHSWPRFRGPNGSGQGVGLNWPTSWNEKAILWKVPLPGVGHGSPVIENGRIYLQAADKAGQERLVMCLSSSDGATLWKQPIAGKRASSMHKKNSLASGSAACDGERVYFCHWDGSSVQLAAYACSDGKPLWTVPLGKHESQHGAGYSPIVAQGKVIVASDGDNHAEVFCVDALSGKIAWSQQRQAYRASYCTPLVRSSHQGEEVIVSSTAGLTGYDLASGQPHWNWAWPFESKPLRSVSSPVLSTGNTLIASAGDGGGDRDSIAVKLPQGDTTEDRTPHLLWQHRRDMPYVTCFVEQNGQVYYVADKGVAGCLDLKTGKASWIQRLAGNFTSSPVLIDGKVIGINEEGELFVFTAQSDRYQSIGRLKLGEEVLASPALADGKLYVRGLQHLFCLGAAK